MKQLKRFLLKLEKAQETITYIYLIILLVAVSIALIQSTITLLNSMAQ